jgi:1,4-dihydroxy-2-naphthoate polyprenyltransferase
MKLRKHHSGISRSKSEKNPPPAWKIWFRAFRLHYVLPSILPALLGSAMALAEGTTIFLLHFVLVIAGVTINHLGINMIDDVMDYRSSVDLQGNSDQNFFTGGSGVLTEGLLHDSQMLKAAGFCFLMTALVGAYLTYACGWPVLFFGLFGMACSIFYTAPPVRFGYRGLGELGLLVNFGPVIVMGSYFVQARNFALEPLIASLVPGLMMWSMIMINEIPDYEADRSGGKWNLVARYGKKAGVTFFGTGLAAAYAVLIIGVWTQILSPWVMAAFLSLPLAMKSFSVMTRHLHDPEAMAPANLAMIKVHALSVSAMVAAYVIEGFHLF